MVLPDKAQSFTLSASPSGITFEFEDRFPKTSPNFLHSSISVNSNATVRQNPVSKQTQTGGEYGKSYNAAPTQITAVALLK